MSDAWPHRTVPGAAPEAVSTNALPADIGLLWDRLELREKPLVLCLEAIIRCVWVDGTALVEDVRKRMADQQRRALQSEVGAELYLSGDAGVELSGHRVDSVLRRLGSDGYIELPAASLSAPGAAVRVLHPLLRKALADAGLVRPEQSSVGLAAPIGSSAAAMNSSPIPHFADLHEDWSQLWFAVQRQAWTTLAIVPASSDRSGLEAAAGLAAAGRQYVNSGIELCDATNVPPDGVERVLSLMEDTSRRRIQLIVALDNPLANPATIPIVRSSTLALLAVRLGGPTLEQSRRTIEVIGREYFVGSVALSPARRG